MAHKRIIEEICADSCPKPQGYCILKELTSRGSDRNLIQLKCVEKFKLERSKKEERDLGWQGAWDLWVREGYAERFKEVYDLALKEVEGDEEKISYKFIYREVMNNG